MALLEVHALHAFGEHDLVDSACGWKGKVREKNKVRNEEGRAAGPQELIRPRLYMYLV